jgi:hypothetical protein
MATMAAMPSGRAIVRCFFENIPFLLHLRASAIEEA